MFVPSFGAAIEPSNVEAFSKNIGLARSADNYGGQIVSKTADSGVNFGKHLDRKGFHVNLVEVSENKNVANEVPKILGTKAVQRHSGTSD